MALSSGVAGCTFDAPADGPRVIARANTRYFILLGPTRFQASHLAWEPEVTHHGGGPWWMPLSQCEVKAEGLKVWTGAYVTVATEGGRCAEIGLWYRGVICQRYVFHYDPAGRLESRVDTDYQWRRPNELVEDWVKRSAGADPAESLVREIGYTWSADGRTVDVTLRASRGKSGDGPPTSLPSLNYGWGEVGRKLETWRLDERGHIVAVRREDVQAEVYSATYDNAGRLLRYTQGSEKAENAFGPDGRILETQVQTSGGTRMVVAHAYPDAPSAKEPETDDPGLCQTYWVIHDRRGDVVKMKACEAADSFGHITCTFSRDRQGRLLIYKLGPTWEPIAGRYVFE